VDEVVVDAPYLTEVRTLDEHECGFCVHGDDVTTMSDGRDCYEEVKSAGRYKECKRTHGVSTTALVGKLLDVAGADPKKVELAARKEHLLNSHSPFLTTSERLLQFSEPHRSPKQGDKIVYVDGDWDLFHLGHVGLLKKAREMGDYVVVGIHDDATVSTLKGPLFPIMSLQERTLCLLACRYVDEVIIGAPFTINRDVLTTGHPIDLVIHDHSQTVASILPNHDPYALAKKEGLYQQVSSEYSHFTTQTLIDRIHANRSLYEERNRRKLGKAQLEAEMESEAKRHKK
jgi:ethanolamine-phosphate cytidylyltransferase